MPKMCVVSCEAGTDSFDFCFFVAYKNNESICHDLYKNDLTLPMKAENNVLRPSASMNASQTADPATPDMA